MEREVFRNEFLSIDYIKPNNFAKLNWKKNTSNASALDFKQWNINLIKKIEEYKPSLLLSDNRDYLFTIFPELQEWSVENVFIPMSKAGVRKLAMLVSSDIFAQVSLEQFADESQDDTDIDTKYFENIIEAENWLIR